MDKFWQISPIESGWTFTATAVWEHDTGNWLGMVREGNWLDRGHEGDVLIFRRDQHEDDYSDPEYIPAPANWRELVIKELPRTPPSEA